MKKRVFAAALAGVCLLSGCSSLLNRTYSATEEHSSKYWESENADTMRAESYQDIVNDLLLLVGRHTEDAAVRLYNYTDDASVSDALEKAATEIQQETPMGAYAVEYITSESSSQRGYYEVTLHISYRRTLEQIQSVVNATSTSALPDLLDAALEQSKTELAVRLGYWGEDEQASVEQSVADVREVWGLTDTAPWTISFYPQTGDVGLIEFVMGDGTQPSAAESADEESTNPQPEISSPKG
ncbi:MAG: hypothetical protein LKJ86_02040 [Oscillibacter sp.]|nr:hypothetical protein [Oscillibacter sp.]